MTRSIIVQRRKSLELSALEELKSLAEAAGYEVVGKLEQIREPDPRYQIGAGKVKELAQLVIKTNARKIIFDNRLKPVQAYNLAKATGFETIDRFQLILEIFARRATTKEAKLQIQLARLRYELARAKERVRLARMEEQPGFMGLGAYEVDIYHKTVQRQIQTISDRLGRIRKRRTLHRKRRAELGFSSISLAGYTNAGKSSLFNALTEEKVPVNDALFTTLSTKTRIVGFSRRKFLLIDTVGFVDRLPLTLVEAFHSTLEETIYSDLIILVVDLNEPTDIVQKKLLCCQETIERIGASGIPVVTALNKVDLLRDEKVQQRLESLNERASNPVPVSALYNVNLDSLKQMILEMLGDYVQLSFSIPLTSESMSFISWLFNCADVQTINYTGEAAHVIFQAIPWFAEKVRKRVEGEFDGKLEKISRH